MLWRLRLREFVYYRARNSVPPLCCLAWMLMKKQCKVCSSSVVILTRWSCWPAQCMLGCCLHRRPCIHFCPHSCWSYNHRTASGFGGETEGTCRRLLDSLACLHTSLFVCLKGIFGSSPAISKPNQQWYKWFQEKTDEQAKPREV